MPEFLALESPKERIITQTHATVKQIHNLCGKYLVSL